jgi:small subunit ribosomal protein S8
MAVTDPVADFLTRIRNAIRAQHKYVDVNWSKLKQNIAEILKEKGLIVSYLVKVDKNNRGTIRIFLKYKEGRNTVIRGLKRVSKPGIRRYVGYKDIPNYYGGFGISIISTSQGVLPGDEAEKRKLGGEILCQVW